MNIIGTGSSHDDGSTKLLSVPPAVSQSQTPAGPGDKTQGYTLLDRSFEDIDGPDRPDYPARRLSDGRDRQRVRPDISECEIAGTRIGLTA